MSKIKIGKEVVIYDFFSHDFLEKYTQVIKECPIEEQMVIAKAMITDCKQHRIVLSDINQIFGEDVMNELFPLWKEHFMPIANIHNDPIEKGYGECVWFCSPSLEHLAEICWDISPERVAIIVYDKFYQIIMAKGETYLNPIRRQQLFADDVLKSYLYSLIDKKQFHADETETLKPDAYSLIDKKHEQFELTVALKNIILLPEDLQHRNRDHLDRLLIKTRRMILEDSLHNWMAEQTQQRVYSDLL